MSFGFIGGKVISVPAVKTRLVKSSPFERGGKLPPSDAVDNEDY